MAPPSWQPRPPPWDEVPGLLLPGQLLSVLSYEGNTSFFSAPWWKGRIRQQHNKVQGYDEVLHQKNDSEFFRFTRVTKNTHAFILDLVKKHYIPAYRGGHFPVDARVALDVTLAYLGNRLPYREISELFGLSEACVHGSVGKIVDIFCDAGGEFIKWPSAQEAAEMERRFRDKAGFMGVIGVLDGTHIPIKSPPNDMKEGYVNSKAGHSVILLATCDDKKKFTFIDVGFPGSAHENKVFASSDLYRGIKGNALAYFPSPFYHIIGGEAFTLSRNVMVPFQDTGMLEPHQVSYNERLSRTRCVIDRSFELLRKRFKRLEYVDADIHRVSSIVTACCVLHNITLNFPEEEDVLLREEPDALEEDTQPIIEQELLNMNASDKRELLALTQ